MNYHSALRNIPEERRCQLTYASSSERRGLNFVWFVNFAHVFKFGKWELRFSGFVHIAWDSAVLEALECKVRLGFIL